ncbi:Glycosyltransferase involved in cell wall bisynthesis [Lutibacter agarilyticus]|uniref:Glycosyltransferase involved in cell wall bisynthesis n=1 Tax=Lutibacter agarilyticus TaxID=1109740 RepID=A0A238VIF0_9FLAO|nr:glycosyltransferase family 4 protein [Lutibacter agarilyticus]SNR33473.1 Glycosyltransferase involved in cell wall bisynthesis [Lutibacter agarilyticus]
MKKLLIIGFVWPEPNATAAGSRMLQLIKLFQKDGYTITFGSTASKTETTFNLENIAINTVKIELNNTSFDDFIKELNPKIVVFDRYLTEEQFGWRVSENCPNALRILDTEDLHFLRNARITAFKQQTKVTLPILMNEVAKREIASIYRCDLTLIISSYEMKLLKKVFKINKSLVHYIPFLVDPIEPSTIVTLPSFEKRANFMTIGNFRHEPNWNAVLYLKNDIWPLIRKQLPMAEMHIYGAYVPNKAQQLHNVKEGFLIKGWAENAETTFKNSKVCLAPLRFGAGLKGKLIDAMKYGAPSVTTSIGAEAMHQNLPWNGFICDLPQDFVDRAVELYTKKEVWSEAQKNGFTILKKCYDKATYEEKLLKKIVKIEHKIEKHRLKNFMGALLMHHSLKSTKYLAKWIEEKNK